MFSFTKLESIEQFEIEMERKLPSARQSIRRVKDTADDIGS